MELIDGILGVGMISGKWGKILHLFLAIFTPYQQNHNSLHQIPKTTKFAHTPFPNTTSLTTNPPLPLPTTPRDTTTDMSTKYIALVAAVALAATSTEAAGLKQHHAPPQAWNLERNARRLSPQEEIDWDAHANIHGTVGQPPQYEVGISAKWDEEQDMKPVRPTKKVSKDLSRATERIAALEEYQHMGPPPLNLGFFDEKAPARVAAMEDPYAPFPTIPHTIWTRGGVKTFDQRFIDAPVNDFPSPSNGYWEEGIFDGPVNDFPSPNTGYFEEGIFGWNDCPDCHIANPFWRDEKPVWHNALLEEDGVVSRSTHKPRGQTKFTKRPQRK